MALIEYCGRQPGIRLDQDGSLVDCQFLLTTVAPKCHLDAEFYGFGHVICVVVERVALVLLVDEGMVNERAVGYGPAPRVPTVSQAQGSFVTEMYADSTAVS